MGDGRDVLIVGAGLAGGAAALALARSGHHPVLVDPMDGSASDAGGAGILGPSDVPAELRAQFPFDRRLLDRRLAFLGPASLVSIDFQEESGPSHGSPSSFVRGRTDPWLSDASVAAGGERRSGRVERLLRSGGTVSGIVLDGMEVRAPLTVLADGPRASELGATLAPPARRSDPRTATLATERLSLPAARLEERFDLAPGSGTSMHALLGWVPLPRVASGFLVTHADSVTVGVRLADIATDSEADGMRAAFRAHPAIVPFLEGATPIAGSARVRHTGPRVRDLEGPGWMLAGDSAGYPDFHGAVLRGRNPSFRSGWLAGLEAARTLGRGSAPPSTRYGRALRAEGVGTGGPDAQDPIIGDARIHGAYPEILTAALHRLMTETGQPKEPVTAALRATRRGSGRRWRSIARDVAGAARRL